MNPETTDPKVYSYLTIVDNRSGHIECGYGSNCLLPNYDHSTSSTSSEKVVYVFEDQRALILCPDLYRNVRPSPISPKTS